MTAPRSGAYAVSMRLLAAAVALLCLSCGGPPSPARLMVLGIDGLDPEAIDLLMSEGKLPHFATLRQQGAYGRFRSAKPLLSPIIWTTIATGKTPDRHGIGHFVAVNERTGEQLPVTSQMRRVRAVWNVLSAAGRHVSVVGWWATWPAETVHGEIVSDHTCYHFLFDAGAAGADSSVGLTHPPELAQALAPLIRRPGDVTTAEAARFVDVPAADLAREFSFADDLSHFRWALATAESYRGIGLHLWREQRPDALLVYIEGVDSTSHLFGHLFRARGLSGELAAQQARYGRAVEEMYVYADELVGEYMAAMDDQTTLVVLSDHGFELGVLQDDPSKTRDLRRVSERHHRLDGVLYLYGNGVRRAARLDRPTLVDVTPTLLALAGLAPAADMPGRVLTEGLTERPEIARIASYETGEAVAGAPAGDAAVDPAILSRLESLGYLDVDSPSGHRNMAAMLFEAGRYEDAVAAYEKLLDEKPDDGGLHASIAGAFGALGRHDEAMRHLDEAVRLEPLNSEAYHNRAVIHEREGRVPEAIAQYRAALRYAPDYEPSRAALTRLGAPRDATPPTDAERLATAMAGRASEAARRGSYDEAMGLLAEAARIAPKLALVHQYRANVAYLMGDRAAAIAALARGLELEPDNALFRENLERLAREGAGTGE